VLYLRDDECFTAMLYLLALLFSLLFVLFTWHTYDVNLIRSLFMLDLPKDVSTLAPYKDGYTDILDERRHTSDITFMSRARLDIPEYKYHMPRSAEEIKQHVLKSDRVKYAVEHVSI